MASQPNPIDISNVPDLLRVAEEVQRSGKPCVLRRDGEDLAVVTPVRKRRRAPSKAAPVTREDALFHLIGIGESKVPGGVSHRKHEYLTKAYRVR